MHPRSLFYVLTNFILHKNSEQKPSDIKLTLLASVDDQASRRLA